MSTTEQLTDQLLATIERSPRVWNVRVIISNAAGDRWLDQQVTVHAPDQLAAIPVAMTRHFLAVKTAPHDEMQVLVSPLLRTI